MSKKDFELIAETLYASRLSFNDDNAFSVLVDNFADALHSTNPRFDRARFVNAARYGKQARRTRR